MRVSLYSVVVWLCAVSVGAWLGYRSGPGAGGAAVSAGKGSLAPGVQDPAPAPSTESIGIVSSDLWGPLGRIVEAPADELPALFESCREYPLAIRSLVREFLLLRWLEVAPQSAAAFLADRKTSRRFASSFYVAWAQRHPREALAFALKESATARGFAFVEPMLEEAVKVEPNAVLTVLEKRSGEYRAPEIWASALEAKFGGEQTILWREAVAYVEGLTPSGQTGAILGLARLWAASDPRAALEWAGSLRTGREDAGAIILRAWGEGDPDAAVAYVEKHGLDPGRFASRAIAQHDPTAALEWILENRRDPPPHEYVSVLNAASRGDPESALDLLDRVPANLRPEVAASHVSRAVRSGSAPGLYVEWLDAQEGGPLKDAVELALFDALHLQGWRRMEEIASALSFGDGPSSAKLRAAAAANRAAHEGDFEDFAQWANTVGLNVNALVREHHGRWRHRDPRKAAELALAMAGHRLDEHYMRQALETWGDEDPQGAASWVTDEVDSVIREPALEQVGQTWAAQDPAAALQWSQSLSLADQLTVVGAVGRGWAEIDPGGAAAWATGIEDEAIRLEAVVAALKTWSGYDPSEASAWAAQLPNGPARDAAAGVLASQLLRHDPAGALEWMGRIEDESLRREAFWALSGPHLPDRAAAIRQAIALSSLSAADRDEAYSNLNPNMSKP